MFERLRSRLTDRGDNQTKGERLFEQGDFAGAELALAEAVVEGERRQQPSDKRILLRLELAEAQRKQFRPASEGGDPNKLAVAEQTIHSALELANKVGEHELALQCLDELAVILADRGNLAEAERVVQAATELEGKIKRRDPLMAARRLHRLGRLRHGNGQSEAGAEALAQCVAIHEQALGANHPDTVRRMSELAAIYHALGRHSETQRCLRSVIKFHEREAGIESAEATSDIRIMVESLEASGDTDGAAALCERVLALKLRVVGVNVDEIADMQASLGHRYIGWSRYSRARELLMEAVATFKRSGGMRLACGYESLGQVEELAGHYHDAIRELERAAKVWESLHPGYVEELIQNLEHRAFLFTQLRLERDAIYLRDKAAVLAQNVRLTAAG